MGRGTSAMSQTSKGLFAVVAVSLTFGAVQLAFGQDLTSRFKSLTGASEQTVGQNVAFVADDGVNRSTKADRLGPSTPPASATETISFKLERLPATSVVVRLPAKEASSDAPASISVKGV